MALACQVGARQHANAVEDGAQGAGPGSSSHQSSRPALRCVSRWQVEAELIPKPGVVEGRAPARIGPWGPMWSNLISYTEQECLFPTSRR
jgi:hypothetical protein